MTKEPTPSIGFEAQEADEGVDSGMHECGGDVAGPTRRFSDGPSPASHTTPARPLGHLACPYLADMPAAAGAGQAARRSKMLHVIQLFRCALEPRQGLRDSAV